MPIRIWDSRDRRSHPFPKTHEADATVTSWVLHIASVTICNGSYVVTESSPIDFGPLEILVREIAAKVTPFAGVFFASLVVGSVIDPVL